MRLGTLRRGRAADALPGVSGVVRLDRRTKDLTKRLNSGEIAVIDHTDIDRVAADALVSTGVAAVVNASTSISGRYPNLGPGILARADIPILDNVGADVFGKVKEGTRVRVDGECLYVGDRLVAEGRHLDGAAIADAMEEAKAGLSSQLEAFAANTMEYMKRERALLLDGVGVPDIKTDLDGKHVLIVVRGYDYKEDLAQLRSYIRDYRPVLIGVDGGADALREAGYKPAIIVGDMDSVADETLRCGAEVIVHAYADGRAPGLPRVQDLGVQAITFPATGTSEDIAMLLADAKGATLIVAVGTHATLVEFLDKGRGGMASTFLTRLRVGAKLVDAKGVSRLYKSRISSTALVFLVLAAFVAIGAVLAVSTAGRTYLDIFANRLGDLLDWMTGLFLVIDFRYHLVSLIAVFLAVALGIVIGTTQLNGTVLDGLEAQVGTLTDQKNSLESEVDTLTEELSQNDAYDDAIAPLIVANRLVGSSVLLIVTNEDVSPEVVAQTTNLLSAAGAQMAGTLRLQPAFTDPQTAPDLQEYVTGTGLPPGVTLPQTDDTPTLVASLMSQVLMRPADGGAAPPVTATRTVMAGLAALGVVTSDSGEVDSADYVLFLTAGGFTGEDAQSRNQALIALAGALDTGGSGAVVGGDAASAAEGGLVTAVRADAVTATSVSTVNNVNSAAGGVAALLALTAERNGQTGHYGVGEDTVPLPPLSP